MKTIILKCGVFMALCFTLACSEGNKTDPGNAESVPVNVITMEEINDSLSDIADTNGLIEKPEMNSQKVEISPNKAQTIGNKDEAGIYPKRGKPEVTGLADITHLKEVMKKLEGTSQKFKISSNKAQTIRGKNGTKIYYEPGKLLTKNGRAPGETIEVELKELVSHKQLLQENAQTVSDEELLVSGGSYFIKMTSDGEELMIKEGENLMVQFPKITSDKKMELFYGERDSLRVMNWKAAQKTFTDNSTAKNVSKPAINTEIKKVELITDTLESGYGSEPFPATTSLVSLSAFTSINRSIYIDTSGKNKYLNKEEQAQLAEDYVNRKEICKAEVELYKSIALKSLGWINCDRFYYTNNKTDFMVSTAPEDSISFVNLYLVFKNIKSVMQSSLSNNKFFPGGKGFKGIPVGEKVKLIAFTVKNGEILAQTYDFAIEKSSGFRLTLKKVSEEELKKLLDNV